MYSKEELKALKREFWESFDAFCRVQPALKRRRKMWVLYDTKVKGTELKFDVGRRGVLVALEINRRQEEDRLAVFDKLTACKERLEAGFPDGLIWDRHYELETGRPVCRIYTGCDGIDLHRRSDWGSFFTFMAQNMYRLERNFLALADFLRE